MRNFDVTFGDKAAFESDSVVSRVSGYSKGKKRTEKDKDDAHNDAGEYFSSGAYMAAYANTGMSAAQAEEEAQSPLVSDNPENIPYYIDALIYGEDVVWQLGPNPTIVSYTFDHIDGNGSFSFGAQNFSLYTASERTQVVEALFEIQNVADVLFGAGATNPFAPSGRDIAFRQADLEPGTSGYSGIPQSFGGGGVDNVITNSYTDFSPGSHGFLVVLHELGHSMGLEHSHEGSVLPEAEDSYNATVMSYDKSSATKTGGYTNIPMFFYDSDCGVHTRDKYIYPETFMIYDIAALQYLYGANTDYNAGDTTYVVDGSESVKTYWDGGGDDTLDASNYTSYTYSEMGAVYCDGEWQDVLYSHTASPHVTIDLREGLEHRTEIGLSFSWNAFGANIENAKSGGGNDVIYGNHLDNHLEANAGHDVIWGEDGNNTLDGGTGQDTLYGGGGDDLLSGGKDSDILYDSHLSFINDNDTLEGGNSSDVLYADGGNDYLYGGAGNDLLTFMYGGVGDDVLNGQDGNDTLHGGSQNDVLLGENGRDKLYGGDHDDWLFGGNGVDTLIGGWGNDSLIGDYLLPGPEIRDYFVFSEDSGHDTVYDFTVGYDKLNFSSFLESFDQLEFDDAGDDTYITAGGHFGMSVKLLHVTSDDLNPLDFIFNHRWDPGPIIDA